MKWFVQCVKKYAVFSGRSHRTEFWMFTLVSFLISVALGFLDLFDLGIVGSLFTLAIFVPSVAVSVRRLHDINRSGWWVLVALIPFIGWLVLLIWAIRKSDEGENRFGAPLSYDVQ